jgi:hypothetical protein
MTWYKLWVDYGNGHQSHDKTYMWFESELKKDERQHVLDNYIFDYDNSIGRIRKVKKVPLGILKHKLEWCKKFIRDNIKNFNSSLKKPVFRMINK